MFKIKKLVLLAALAAAALSACGKTPAKAADDGKLTVIASFYPMYDFSCKIGGDRVSVTDLVPAGTEPHDWEPAASDLRSLEQADVFVYSGAGMEHWAEDVLNSLSSDHLTAAEASDGIALLGGDGNTSDPHVWLNPQNAKRQMENIKTAFSKADPEGADYYEANYQKWAGRLDALDEEFKQTLSPLPKKEIVVSHEAFGYLCQAYGLSQLGIEGLMPDSEPDPARMAEITDFVRQNDIRVIFSEELVSTKAAQTIAEETGASLETLNPLEGLSDAQLAAGDDYFSVMRDNLAKLADALQ